MSSILVKQVDVGSVQLFLKVVGSDGKPMTADESPLKKDHSEIQSFTISSSAQWDPKHGTTAQGGVTVSSLSVSRVVLPSSPLMFNAVINEDPIKSVEVVAQRKGAKDVVFTVKLEDARISSCNIAGSSEASMNESLTFEGVRLMIRHEVGPKEISWDWTKQQSV